MSTKSKPWTARRIHLWVAIILSIPMLLMAASGILISMRSVTKIQVPISWMGSETIPERLPITAYLETPDGTTWIGNSQGLYAIVNGVAQPVKGFEGQEVVGLAAVTGKPAPVVATRMAVWTETEGNWQAVKRGRVRQLSALPEGRVLVISGGRGEMADGKPMVTTDGENWRPYPAAMKANKLLPKLESPTVQLHQFMRELHSGAYFFGKGTGEMVWSNIIGWVLVLLALTGLWMWLIRERRRAAERGTASQVAAPSRDATAEV